MDENTFEESIEQAEREADECLERENQLKSEEQEVQSAIQKLREDLEVSGILDQMAAEKQTEIGKTQDELDRIREQAESLAASLNEMTERNEGSKAVLKELEMLGEEVTNGLAVIEERQLVIENCRDQLQELLDKLGMAGDLSDSPAESGGTSGVVEKQQEKEGVDTPSSLGDYYFAHNYSEKDYPEYSQDPDWRLLMRKQYPDIKLPPMSQETAQNCLRDYMFKHNYSRADFSTYSKDPKWRYLTQKAYPDYRLPPRENADNLGGWTDSPYDETFSETIQKINPNYGKGVEWITNCQRCVPAFEMRMRGYNVDALGCADLDTDWLAKNWEKAWENPEVRYCKGTGLDEISQAMGQWGDGARAQITIDLKGIGYGHTFVAVQKGNRTIFIDPQSGSLDASSLFSRAEVGQTSFCRIDTLMPSKELLQCCKEN